MTAHQQIAKAIGAHGMWKARLLKAIDLGTSDTTPASAGQDNQCDFGKWLYGNDLTSQTKHSAHFEECRNLHRQFHLVAAKVLIMALARQKDQATVAMATTSEFAKVSSALTLAMMNWDKAEGPGS